MSPPPRATTAVRRYVDAPRYVPGRATIEPMEVDAVRRSLGRPRSTTPRPVSSSSRSGTRCAGSPACPPSSPTSPRSNTASCASSGSCWSGSGPRAPSTDAENSLTELAALAETAGSQVLEGLIQRRSRPDAATFIGRGKVDELRDVVIATGADTVICDGELSPSQLRNLEQQIKVKVIDRTALILDIFAQHAKSKEGKAQVELAQLQYLLPRLRGWGEALSRQAGGSGAVAAPAAASACAVPVRPSSRPTGGASAPASPGSSARSRRWRTIRDTKRATPAPQPGAERGHRRLHQRRQVQPAQPAHRRGRAGRGRAVRHPRPDHAPGRAPPTAGSTRCPTRSASSGTCRTRSSRRSARRWRRSPTPTWSCTSSTARTPTRRIRSARSARCSPRSAPTRCRSCWSSTRSTPPTRRRCCGSSGRGRTRSSSPPAPAPASTSCALAIEARLPRPAVELDVLRAVRPRGPGGPGAPAGEVLETSPPRRGHAAAGAGRRRPGGRSRSVCQRTIGFPPVTRRDRRGTYPHRERGSAKLVRCGVGQLWWVWRYV